LDPRLGPAAPKEYFCLSKQFGGKSLTIWKWMADDLLLPLLLFLAHVLTL
jgi:hypothetical protein